MARIFMKNDCEELLKNKYVVVIGDSVHRGIYKDLVVLLNSNRYLRREELKIIRKLMPGSKFLYGGNKATMHNGINYSEARQFRTRYHLLRYYYVTRVYTDYMETVINEISSGSFVPDVVIINSTLWDMTRYGTYTGPVEFRRRLPKLLKLMKNKLPASTLIIFTLCPPTSQDITGGLIIDSVSHARYTLRFDVMNANDFVAEECAKHDIDTLDMHHHLRNQLYLREGDGVHWMNKAHRRISQLILTHIAQAWQRPMPDPVTDSKTMMMLGRSVEEEVPLTFDEMPRVPRPLMAAVLSSNMPPSLMSGVGTSQCMQRSAQNHPVPHNPYTNDRFAGSQVVGCMPGTTQQQYANRQQVRAGGLLMGQANMGSSNSLVIQELNKLQQTIHSLQQRKEPTSLTDGLLKLGKPPMQSSKDCFMLDSAPIPQMAEVQNSKIEEQKERIRCLQFQRMQEIACSSGMPVLNMGLNAGGGARYGPPSDVGENSIGYRGVPMEEYERRSVQGMMRPQHNNVNMHNRQRPYLLPETRSASLQMNPRYGYGRSYR